MSDNLIIVCTQDELDKMIDSGEIKDEETSILKLSVLFDVLCEHYGVNPHWQPNDIY